MFGKVNSDIAKNDCTKWMVGIVVAPFQEKWIKKRIKDCNFGHNTDYLYALIQEDMTKYKHNPLRITELKKLAMEYKRIRSLNSSNIDWGQK